MENNSDFALSTPRTDQRLKLLKNGHSNCLPKWEDFSKKLERELNKWKNKCNQHELVAKPSKEPSEEPSAT